MDVQYCPNCGTPWCDDYNNPGTCQQCSKSITNLGMAMAETNAAFLVKEATARIEDIAMLTQGLCNINAFQAQEYLHNIWHVLKPAKKEELVNELISRLLEKILKGDLDHKLLEVLKEELGQHETLIGSFLIGNDELTTKVRLAVSKRIADRMKDRTSSMSLSIDVALNNAVSVLATRVFDNQRQGIEAQVRDRIAAELPELMEATVKKITERAIDEVRRKVERS